ncbi:hypothetical protein [Chitinophaga defluvii]|uniref:Uncharacterized protein n=1 Tax=Chitinophaga defluvii TaxID=3163343 RepID=A0ABV2TCI2_9BACT
MDDHLLKKSSYLFVQPITHLWYVPLREVQTKKEFSGPPIELIHGFFIKERLDGDIIKVLAMNPRIEIKMMPLQVGWFKIENHSSDECTFSSIEHIILPKFKEIINSLEEGKATAWCVNAPPGTNNTILFDVMP